MLRLELENASKAVLYELHRSGVRVATATAADLDRQMRSKDGLHTARLYIIEATDNRVVYHPEIPAGDRMPLAFVNEMFAREQGSIEYTFQGTSRYAVFTTVQPIGWLLGLSISKSEMLEKRLDFLRNIGAITFAILCLNALVVSLFGRRLLKRIGTALDCVNRIEQGDLSARIAVIPADDEVGRLQEGINAMSARIEQRTLEQQDAEKALKEREARIRRLVESNIIGIFIWDLRGNIIDANDAFLDMIGYTSDDLAAGKILWTELTLPEYGDIDAHKADEVRRTGSCTPYEKAFRRKDGSCVPVLLGAAMFEGEGETGVAFVLDLTERKRVEEALRKAHDELELRVQERTSDLRRANQRLELEIQERRQAEAVLA